MPLYKGWCQLTDTAVEIESGFERLLCFGAYEGKRQVGFARVVSEHATFGYLQDFIVDPAWRGRGIGRSLLKRAPNPHDLMARYRNDSDSIVAPPC
jgi:ribosomal protein S18 acetylase RimI-like enzyme